MSFTNVNRGTDLPLFRLAITMLVCLLISACATKKMVPTEGSGDFQALQEDYRLSVDALTALENSSKNPTELGVFKDNDELLEIKQKLLAIHDQKPWYPGPILNLGLASWWLGESEEAKGYFQKVLALDESLSGVDGNQLNEGALGSLSEQEREAILDNLHTFTVPALNYAGVLSRELGEFEQSEAYYRQALEQDSENLAALRNLAILLDLYMGKHAEALPLYEQYQSLLDEPDPKVKDWIFDIKNRL